MSVVDIFQPNETIFRKKLDSYLAVIPPSGGGTGTSTVFTEGSVVFAGASGIYSQDNANFFWNDTSNTLNVAAFVPTGSTEPTDGGLYRGQTGLFVTSVDVASLTAPTASGGSVHIGQGGYNTTAQNLFTALSWSGGIVTATTTTAHGLSPGSVFLNANVAPSGYNGIFTATAGTTGSTLKWASADFGAATVFGGIGYGQDLFPFVRMGINTDALGEHAAGVPLEVGGHYNGGTNIMVRNRGTGGTDASLSTGLILASDADDLDFQMYLTGADNTGSGMARSLYAVINIGDITFQADYTSARNVLTLKNNGDVIVGTGAAIATTATAGFLDLPTCAGTPTGVPTVTGAGKANFIYDTTANKLWVYNGAWRMVAVV